MADQYATTQVTPQEALTRRHLLRGLPVACAAITLPAGSSAAPAADGLHDKLTAILAQLDSSHEWEPAATVMARAYAAHLIRDAFDLPARPEQSDDVALYHRILADAKRDHRRWPVSPLTIPQP